MRRLRGVSSIVGAAALSWVALTGCGSASSPSSSAPNTSVVTSVSTSGPAATFPVPSIVVTRTAGLPPGAPSNSGTSYVTWGGAGQLLVVTFGSSTCPKLPESVAVTGSNAITVTMADTSALTVPCTMDFGPTTSTVAVPTGIDDTKDVQVAIEDQESTLTPRPR